jgi:threonine aldolase
MCSFDTTEEDVDAFVAAIRHELRDHGSSAPA